MERLARRASTTAELARLMSPIGLDIGARTPEETAISICAEIIAARTGRGPVPRTRTARSTPEGVESRGQVRPASPSSVSCWAARSRGATWPAGWVAQARLRRET